MSSKKPRQFKQRVSFLELSAFTIDYALKSWAEGCFLKQSITVSICTFKKQPSQLPVYLIKRKAAFSKTYQIGIKK